MLSNWDIGHFMGRRSSEASDFAYLISLRRFTVSHGGEKRCPAQVFVILETVGDGRFINQMGTWNGIGEVQSEFSVRAGSSFRISWFNILLFVICAWRRAAAKGSIYCGAGIFVVGKRWRVVFGARGTDFD